MPKVEYREKNARHKEREYLYCFFVLFCFFMKYWRSCFMAYIIEFKGTNSDETHMINALNNTYIDPMSNGPYACSLSVYEI